MRQVVAALWLVLLLLTVPDFAVQGHVAVVSVTVLVLLASVFVLTGRHERLILHGIASDDEPSDDERCLRGSFRRMTSPDTPGRLGRPRAPGEVRRLA